MAMNKPQVASILSLKTRREYIHVALVTASLLSPVLKNSMETTSLFFVHSHNKLREIQCGAQCFSLLFLAMNAG